MRSLRAAKEVIGSGAGVGYCCARSLSVDSAASLVSGSAAEPIAELPQYRNTFSGGFNGYQGEFLGKRVVARMYFPRSKMVFAAMAAAAVTQSTFLWSRCIGSAYISSLKMLFGCW